MKKYVVLAAFSFLSITSIGQALAQHNHDMSHMTNMSTQNHNQNKKDSITSSSSAYDTEIQAVNARMHEGMSFKSSGHADYDFLKGMIAHHQGAVDMAKLELKYGTHEKTKKLAQNIIQAQEKEIQLMKMWLEDIKTKHHITD